MTKKDTRDLIGYGSNLPKVEWPNKARIAVQIVLNYEEGAENCVLNGDKNSEIRNYRRSTYKRKAYEYGVAL